MKAFLSALSALILSVLLPVVANSAGLAQDDNFIVLTPARPSQEAGRDYANLVLQRAESYRSEFVKEWLGGEPPSNNVRTIISVHFSATENSGLTWAKDDPSRRFHNVYLTTSASNAAGPMLRHEIAHTVMATKYPHPNRLPPWAEEGIASRYDSESLMAFRQQVVTSWLRMGRVPLLANLLDSPNIESFADDQYAASESLVRFLLTRGSKPTVLAFAEAGQKHGWDAALVSHYGINDIGELQSEWQGWLNGSEAVPQR
jgi:hypothetical protein